MGVGCFAFAICFNAASKSASFSLAPASRPASMNRRRCSSGVSFSAPSLALDYPPIVAGLPPYARLNDGLLLSPARFVGAGHFHARHPACAERGWLLSMRLACAQNPSGYTNVKRRTPQCIGRGKRFAR